MDTYRLRGLRHQLINELRSKGFEEKILEAFKQVKRHLFLDSAFSDWAYRDTAFPIDADQTISQPSTVALQTQLLEIKAGDKVLEIGTGSGFQACILSQLGAKVYTIERQKLLFHKTNKLLVKIGFSSIRTLFGDGNVGAPRFAPYDKIIVTCGATHIPPSLLDQLKFGGIMVIPVGRNDTKTMVRIKKDNFGKVDITRHGQCSFVPFLDGTDKKNITTQPKSRVTL